MSDAMSSMTNVSRPNHVVACPTWHFNNQLNVGELVHEEHVSLFAAAQMPVTATIIGLAIRLRMVSAAAAAMMTSTTIRTKMPLSMTSSTTTNMPEKRRDRICCRRLRTSPLDPEAGRCYDVGSSFEVQRRYVGRATNSLLSFFCFLKKRLSVSLCCVHSPWNALRRPAERRWLL